MSKYQKLTDYLLKLEGESFMTNLDALQIILGFELPPSAHQYPAWWANQGRGQSLAWQSAGWKTADVSLGLGTICFVRTNSEEETRWDELNRRGMQSLTIAQAKQALAATFGVSPENIEITIRV